MERRRYAGEGIEMEEHLTVDRKVALIYFCNTKHRVGLPDDVVNVVRSYVDVQHQHSEVIDFMGSVNKGLPRVMSFRERRAIDCALVLAVILLVFSQALAGSLFTRRFRITGSPYVAEYLSPGYCEDATNSKLQPIATHYSISSSKCLSTASAAGAGGVYHNPTTRECHIFDSENQVLRYEKTPSRTCKFDRPNQVAASLMRSSTTLKHCRQLCNEVEGCTTYELLSSYGTMCRIWYDEDLHCDDYETGDYIFSIQNKTETVPYLEVNEAISGNGKGEGSCYRVGKYSKVIARCPSDSALPVMALRIPDSENIVLRSCDVTNTRLYLAIVPVSVNDSDCSTDLENPLNFTDESPLYFQNMQFRFETAFGADPSFYIVSVLCSSTYISMSSQGEIIITDRESAVPWNLTSLNTEATTETMGTQYSPRSDTGLSFSNQFTVAYTDPFGNGEEPLCGKGMIAVTSLSECESASRSLGLDFVANPSPEIHSYCYIEGTHLFYGPHENGTSMPYNKICAPSRYFADSFMATSVGVHTFFLSLFLVQCKFIGSLDNTKVYWWYMIISSLAIAFLLVSYSLVQQEWFDTARQTAGVYGLCEEVFDSVFFLVIYRTECLLFPEAAWFWVLMSACFMYILVSFCHGLTKAGFQGASYVLHPGMMLALCAMLTAALVHFMVQSAGAAES